MATGKRPRRASQQKRAERLFARLKDARDQIQTKSSAKDIIPMDDVGRAMDDLSQLLGSLKAPILAIHDLMMYKCEHLQQSGFHKRKIRAIQSALDRGFKLFEEVTKEDGLASNALKHYTSAIALYEKLLRTSPKKKRPKR